LQCVIHSKKKILK